MNMDAISSDRHLWDLCWLYDNTESHIRSLKSLGIEATSLLCPPGQAASGTDTYYQ